MTLDSTIDAGQTGHITDHEEIHELLGGPIIRNTDTPTHGAWYTFGNKANSMGFAGTGTPAEAYAPFVVYQEFGDTGGDGTSITKTTQGSAFVTTYWGPTTDDSAQATSFFIALKQADSAYTQTKQLTSVESHTQIEGSNNATGGVTPYGARFTNASGSVTTVTMFRVGTLANSGTVSNFYGFKQDTTCPGTVTNKWGVYVVDRVQSETGVRIAKSGNGMDFRVEIGQSQFVYVKNPDDETTTTTVRIDAIASQTAALTEWHDTAGATRAAVTSAGVIRTAGNGFLVQDGSNNNFFKLNTSGPEWLSSSLEQATVGAAGAASAVPATPTKYLKVKDSAGTTLVIPAFAAA